MSNKIINVKISPQFTEASTRENINSGDNIKTVFGKIRKWFSDLKTVAFTGSYNDLTDKPTIPTANVTGVKGGSETSYRTGNVNLTPANIGAATSAQGAKADSAVQTIQMNGETVSKIDGVVNLGNVITEPTPVYIECTTENFNKAVSLLKANKAVFGTIYRSSIYHTIPLSYNSSSSSKTIFGLVPIGLSGSKIQFTELEWTSRGCALNPIYVNYSIY